MEGELRNFISTWMTVVASLCYCHGAAKLTAGGPGRLLAFLPVMILFLLLPLSLTTVFLCGPTSFFVSWLATFKLALFAHSAGPLHATPPLPLRRFLLLASLPIKIQQNDSKIEIKRHKLMIVKLLIYSTNLAVYRMRERIHPKVFMFLFSVYTYIGFEFILAVTARLARAWLGVEIEPQFDEPYLSTSLQDFWGRRWNIMASNVLRPAVYDPVRSISGRWIGRRWAPLPAVVATFLVSGAMHEVIFFHLGRKWPPPSWGVTGFFALHGACVALEIAVKRKVGGRWCLPPVVSGALATGFVMATGMWLFWPALMRFDADERGNRELLAAVGFVGDVVRSVIDLGLQMVRSLSSFFFASN